MLIKTYLFVLPVLLLFDGIWIGLISKNFYQKQIGFLMSNHPNYIAAVIFYLIYAVAIAVFVINPSIEKRSLIDLVTKAAFFGLVCYGTYDLTNMAIIKNWSLVMTIVDMLWGLSVTVLTSLVTYLFILKVLK